MKLVDVHAHLNFEGIKEKFEEVIQNAKKAGLALIINSGVNPESNLEILEQVKKHPEILKASFGIYPIDALIKHFPELKDDAALRKINPFDIEEAISWIKTHRQECIAIGEVGMDFKMIDPDKNKPPELVEKMKSLQRQNFRKIIQLAKEIKKPLIIHSRKAEAEVIQMLEQENFNNVVMHCFSGRKSLIKKGVENNYFFSVPPVITRLDHFKMLVQLVPLKQLLTETDSPFLSPTIDKKNEPANVLITINEIAKIKKIPKEKVAQQIWENAAKIFNIK